ncbi:MAG: helix-turn-helix transcriptional regulator [Candidatus Marinimicrobia bacterium]|nr:helix-turn-helix transcriptional regulator [Candidatus Neomarinimicrobiota bacterium]
MTQFEKQAVKIFKALADLTRYKIIRLLVERTELSCGDFDREFDISKPALSNHYRIPQFRQIHLHQNVQFMEE